MYVEGCLPDAATTTSAGTSASTELPASHDAHTTAFTTGLTFGAGTTRTKCTHNAATTAATAHKNASGKNETEEDIFLSIFALSARCPDHETQAYYTQKRVILDSRYIYESSPPLHLLRPNYLLSFNNTNTIPYV